MNEVEVAAEALPKSVRYIKNGIGGQWWKVAKANGQVHAGWGNVPDELLRTADLAAIKQRALAEYGDTANTTRDFTALTALLDRPSQHVWVTFQDDCMWWCTVHDAIETNPDSNTKDRGHFWLTCASQWSDHSLNGKRRLAVSGLPGTVASVAGFRGTVCTPSAWETILRIIRNEEDPDVRAAAAARRAYQDAITKLIALLGPKDFEVLIDLILARSGWARLEKVGGVRADIDIEVKNFAADEIAFVQVKSAASQSTLNDSVVRFNAQRGRYQRMIFAVHSPATTLTAPRDQPVQVWSGDRIAELVVNVGLGEWVAGRM